jgi:hypothetical protein
MAAFGLRGLFRDGAPHQYSVPGREPFLRTTLEVPQGECSNFVGLRYNLLSGVAYRKQCVTVLDIYVSDSLGQIHHQWR